MGSKRRRADMSIVGLGPDYDAKGPWLATLAEKRSNQIIDMQ